MRWDSAIGLVAGLVALTGAVTVVAGRTAADSPPSRLVAAQEPSSSPSPSPSPAPTPYDDGLDCDDDMTIGFMADYDWQHAVPISPHQALEDFLRRTYPSGPKNAEDFTESAVTDPTLSGDLDFTYRDADGKARARFTAEIEGDVSVIGSGRLCQTTAQRWRQGWSPPPES